MDELQMDIKRYYTNLRCSNSDYESSSEFLDASHHHTSNANMTDHSCYLSEYFPVFRR